MRNWSMGVAAVAALLAAACGSSGDAEVAAAALAIEAAPQSIADGALAADAVSGRAALAAAEGTPHVLWFWGAH